MKKLNALTRLHPLGQCPQIARCDFDGSILTRGRIKNTLLLDIHAIGATGVPHGMAAGIPECCFLAGFYASASHELAKATESREEKQTLSTKNQPIRHMQYPWHDTVMIPCLLSPSQGRGLGEGKRKGRKFFLRGIQLHCNRVFLP